MWPPRPDQQTDLPVPYAPGSRSGANLQAPSLATSGLALDATVQATNGQLTAGVAPAVVNYQTKSLILAAPSLSPYTLYTFTGNGRIWKALVTFAMGSASGTGVTQGYAQVLIQGGATLAIVECCVVGSGAGASDSDTDPETFNGLAVNSGTVVQFDVNNAVVPTGVTLRASALVGFSIP